MVERVAKAICSANGVTWDNLDEDFREEYRSDARAAIAAMREPTDAMIGASLDCYMGGKDHGPEDHWKAMIDAALSDSKEEDQSRARNEGGE